ncbi:hypothetical protein L6452_33950 [Arctium lappa]|uniref:Uncharacterized protein n=1 Tax=Arctium lappa TaxID=4217 RepID=A0ACB8YGW5_ARCLA|nr:hypothetical protein L6452_33950 [Arctium lappa]
MIVYHLKALCEGRSISVDLSLSISLCPISEVMDIDSVGTFTMCHEAFKYPKKGAARRMSDNCGVILNISATLYYTTSWYQIHVAAAKAAVDAITRNLALEWGTDYDIRVNGITSMDYINTSHPNFVGGSKAVEIVMQQVKSSKIATKISWQKV